MEVLGYFAAIIMGVTLGLIGGGGSILTVPILVYLFQLDPLLSTSYSLFIVGLTALVGGISYAKKGEVDFKTGFLFAVPSFISVYLTRAYFIPWLPEPVFEIFSLSISKAILVMMVFSVLMLLASISMIKVNKKATPKELSPSFAAFIIILEGFIVGMLTGFVGAGGGFLIIPALVVLVGLPMKKAVGTSLFIIAIKSLLGFTGDIQAQADIEWVFLGVLSFLAVIGIFIGLKFSNYFSEKSLKVGFGYFILIMGFFILLDQLRGLS